MPTKIISRKLKNQKYILLLTEESASTLPCIDDFKECLRSSRNKVFAHLNATIDDLPYRGVNRAILDGLLLATKHYYKHRSEKQGVAETRLKIFEEAQIWREQFFINVDTDITSSAYSTAWSNYVTENPNIECEDFFADVHTQVIIDYPIESDLQDLYWQAIRDQFNLRQLKLLAKSMQDLTVFTGQQSFNVKADALLNLRKTRPADFVKNLLKLAATEEHSLTEKTYAVVKLKEGGKYQDFVIDL